MNTHKGTATRRKSHRRTGKLLLFATLLSSVTIFTIPANAIAYQSATLIASGSGDDVSAAIYHQESTYTEKQPESVSPSEQQPENVNTSEQKKEYQIQHGTQTFDIFKNVPVNSYKEDGVFYIDNSGVKRYKSELYDSVLGIDVSTYQGNIDWPRVKASGVDFAMIRVGFRGYSEGILNEDTMFQTNIKGALEAGLEVGVYFFSQAITVEEAIAEAEFVLERIRGFDISYGLVKKSV